MPDKIEKQCHSIQKYFNFPSSTAVSLDQLRPSPPSSPTGSSAAVQEGWTFEEQFKQVSCRTN